jgi:hypothetical protein
MHQHCVSTTSQQMAGQLVSGLGALRDSDVSDDVTEPPPFLLPREGRGGLHSYYDRANRLVTYICSVMLFNLYIGTLLNTTE